MKVRSQRKAQSDQRGQKDQRPLPRERQARQRQVAGNADGRHGNVHDLGKVAVVHDAAVPLLVDRAGLVHRCSSERAEPARKPPRRPGPEWQSDIASSDFDATRAPAQATMDAMDEFMSQPPTGRRVAFSAAALTRPIWAIWPWRGLPGGARPGHRALCPGGRAAAQAAGLDGQL